MYVLSLDEFSVFCSDKVRAEDRPTLIIAVLALGENPVLVVEQNTTIERDQAKMNEAEYIVSLSSTSFKIS